MHVQPSIRSTTDLLNMVVITAGMLLNAFFLHQPIIGVAFTLAYGLYLGHRLGTVLLPAQLRPWQMFWGSLGVVAVVSVLGTIAFHTIGLGRLAIAGSLILIPVGIASLRPWRIRPAESATDELTTRTNFTVVFLGVGIILLDIFLWVMLLRSATTDAIRSPWQVIPSEFFVLYALATFALVAAARRSTQDRRMLLLVIIHMAISLTVASSVYRLGFGFDSHLHMATETAIARDGIITPRPWYYVGQYSVVVMSAFTTSLSVRTIDRILVPWGLAIFLPLAIYCASRFLGPTPRSRGVLPLVALTLPFAAFIVTTPQAFANLILVIAVLFSTAGLSRRLTWGELTYVGLLTLAILAVHPLTGIPALAFLGLLCVEHLIGRSTGTTELLRKGLMILGIVAASLVLPLLFISLGGAGRARINPALLTSPQQLQDAFSFLAPYTQQHYQMVLDLAYTYGQNALLIFGVIGIVGYAVLRLHQRRHGAGVYLLAVIGAVGTYAVLKIGLIYPNLVESERDNYAARLLDIAGLFLLPLTLAAWQHWLERINASRPMARLLTTVVLTIAITSSLYFSYPRVDPYHFDRGYNLTASDIAAVHAIQLNDRGRYIVLANQMTAAAAVREFGFARYYPATDGSDRQIFYYPIPTGDVLYRYYLAMVNDRPSHATAMAAAALTNVPTVYFVLPQYWHDAERLTEEARREADETLVLDNGKIMVFKYVRK